MKAKNTLTAGLLLLSFNLFAQVQGPFSSSTFQNIAIVGSTSTWSNLNNVTSSNDTYATNTTNLASNGDYTDYLQITGFNFTIPNMSVINGIKVEVERSDESGKIRDYRIRIVKNGIIGTTDKSVNAAWSTSDQYRTYGGATDLWGEVWTYSDINSGNFGFAIAVRRQGGGGGTTFAQVDHIRITIYYSSILPVEISSFSAHINDNHAVIRWATASEKNNDHFTLERSNDGILFSPIAEVKGAGNSQEELTYEFIDKNIKSGYTYYRLKQIDYDQTSHYSDIVSINNMSTSYFSIDVYPNTYSEWIIEISGLSKPTTLLVEIIDLSGKIYMSQLIEMSNTQNYFTYSIAENNSISSIGIIRATTSEGYITKKVKLK